VVPSIVAENATIVHQEKMPAQQSITRFHAQECLPGFVFLILMSSEGVGGVLGHPGCVAYFGIDLELFGNFTTDSAPTISFR
jgi:hypothetical protein